jgi:hypothetical protein
MDIFVGCGLRAGRARKFRERSPGAEWRRVKAIAPKREAMIA